jgi:hypothetical protein
VTFIFGALINGNFNIGTDAGSTLYFEGSTDIEKPYTIVEGDSDVGSATVDIDSADIPSGLKVPTVIVLIDGSTGAMTGVPANDKLIIEKYTFNILVKGDQLIAELVQSQADGGSNYVITASASAGASISPSGTTSVAKGGDKTFTFAASSVKVDGKELSAEEVAKGFYTFSNVLSNHTIEVSGTPSRLTFALNITIIGGDGYAEYSVNGSPFVRYTQVATLQEGSDLILKATAEKGYSFKEWKMGETAFLDKEISFDDISGSLTLSLYLEEGGDGGGFPWWIVAVIIILLIILIVVVLLYRRKKG